RFFTFSSVTPSVTRGAQACQPRTSEQVVEMGALAARQREGEGLGLWKCYSATTRIKASDFARWGATKLQRCYVRCYRVLHSVGFTGNRAGFSCRSRLGAERECKSWWWRHPGGRGVLGSSGCRRRVG